MKNVIVACVMLMLLCSASGGTGEVEEVKDTMSVTDRLPDDLVRAIDSFYAAIEADDIEARVALLAEDVVMMPNHWTMSRGKEDVSAVFRAAEGAVFRIRERDVVKAEVSSGLAYTVNSYFYTYHAADDEPQWHKTKNIHIWRRDSEGRWRLEVDIWNTAAFHSHLSIIG